MNQDRIFKQLESAVKDRFPNGSMITWRRGRGLATGKIVGWAYDPNAYSGGYKFTAKLESGEEAEGTLRSVEDISPKSKDAEAKPKTTKKKATRKVTKPKAEAEATV